MQNGTPAPPAAAAGEWLAPIYAAWGGNATDMAADIGEQPVLTNQWRFRGRIPERYWERIIVEAAKRGTTLAHRDFIHPDYRHDDLAAAE